MEAPPATSLDPSQKHFFWSVYGTVLQKTREISNNQHYHVASYNILFFYLTDNIFGGPKRLRSKKLSLPRNDIIPKTLPFEL